MKPNVTVIVGGKLSIVKGMRDEFIERSCDAVKQARANGDCIDFAVSIDPIEPNRVNVFEAWASTEALENFRGEGPDDALSELIEGAEVGEYRASRN